MLFWRQVTYEVFVYANLPFILFVLLSFSSFLTFHRWPMKSSSTRILPSLSLFYSLTSFLTFFYRWPMKSSSTRIFPSLSLFYSLTSFLTFDRWPMKSSSTRIFPSFSSFYSLTSFLTFFYRWPMKSSSTQIARSSKRTKWSSSPISPFRYVLRINFMNWF